MANTSNSLQLLATPTGTTGSKWQSLLHRWRKLSGDSRSVIVVALLAALVAAAIVTILWTSSHQYVPLYGKQEMFDTAAMLEVLETEGIDFQLDDRSGNVMVSKDKVASARMKLAARGVTAKMPVGIDGLGDISALSTSQFMESSRYTHAVEGELAMTIMALKGITNARVHLAIPKRTLFVGREEQKPTASVMLDLAAPLDASQVEAIINLVSGSITGLKPGAVSVVDQTGQLLSAGMGEDTPARVSSRQMDYVTRYEDRIVKRAGDMLEPMLGAQNYRIRVSADLDFSQIEETRETLDGTPVLLSENSVLDNTTDPLALGIPGALANQPPQAQDGQEQPEGEQAPGSRREEFTRRFETGRSVTHTRFEEARVDSLSVSVLVNDNAAGEAGWSQAQLDKMAEIVSTAVGIVPARGDVISLKSAPFVVVAPPVVQPEPVAWWQDMTPWENYLRYALGSIMLLLLVIFGIRPLVKHLTNPQGSGQTQMARREEPAFEAAEGEQAHAAQAIARPRDPGTQAGGALPSGQDENDQHALRLPPPGSELEVQLQHLRLLADQETTRVTEVIKAWIQDDGRTTS